VIRGSTSPCSAPTPKARRPPTSPTTASSGSAIWSWPSARDLGPAPASSAPWTSAAAAGVRRDRRGRSHALSGLLRRSPRRRARTRRRHHHLGRISSPAVRGPRLGGQPPGRSRGPGRPDSASVPRRRHAGRRAARRAARTTAPRTADGGHCRKRQGPTARPRRRDSSSATSSSRSPGMRPPSRKISWPCSDPIASDGPSR